MSFLAARARFARRARTFGLALVATICCSLAASTAAAQESTLPDGKIVFVSDRDSDLRMYTMNADGSGQTKVTASPRVPDGELEPSWSPDGTEIAFTSSARTYIVGADGSGLTGPLVLYGVNHFEPAWSPDGRKIAFQSMDYGTYDIFVVNADGSGLMRLTDDALGDWEPVWSPDGRRIAFARKLSDVESDIYVMNADGSGQTRLTSDPGRDFSPDWSPDGTKIVFSRRQAETLSQIYVMNADGSGQVQLTSNEGHATEPKWSPDGTHIVFTGPDVEIYVMKADGSEQTPLTSNTFWDLSPDWGPQQDHLSVTRLGAGSGTVTSAPAGIDCGSDCAELYPHGTAVVLTAAAAPGSVFMGWGGACRGVTAPCAVSVDIKKVATARFALIPAGCAIVGTAGSDDLVGTSGPDRFCAFGGDDVLRGRGGSDILIGGPGDDRLVGGSGSDRLEGRGGDDSIAGGPNQDNLFGGRGRDSLFARDSIRDALQGGRGHDHGRWDRGLDLVRSVERFG